MFPQSLVLDNYIFYSLRDTSFLTPIKREDLENIVERVTLRSLRVWLFNTLLEDIVGDVLGKNEVEHYHFGMLVLFYFCLSFGLCVLTSQESKTILVIVFANKHT